MWDGLKLLQSVAPRDIEFEKIVILFQKHASQFVEFTSAAEKVVEVVLDRTESGRRFVFEDTSQNDVIALLTGSTAYSDFLDIQLYRPQINIDCHDNHGINRYFLDVLPQYAVHEIILFSVMCIPWQRGFGAT